MMKRKSRYLTISAGCPDRRADRRQQRQQHEDRQQQDLPPRHQAVPQHQAGQDRETDQEIDQRDHDRRQRHDQTREVDLGDQVGAADHAERGLAQHRGEQRPGQQAREHHDRVGCAALRRQLGQRAEHHREDHHGHERPHEGPDDADHGLLVAHRHVAPGQDEEQLPVAPEIDPVLVIGAARFEDQRPVVRVEGTHAAPVIRRGWARRRASRSCAAADEMRPTVGLDRRGVGRPLPQQPRHRLDQAVDVAGIDEFPDPLVGNGIAAAAAGAADHPQPAGGRLEVDDAKPFFGARHDEEIGQAIEIWQILVGHVTEKAHGARLAGELAGARLEPGAIVAVAGHDVNDAGKACAQRRQGREHQLMALVAFTRRQAADGEQDRARARAAGARAAPSTAVPA